ncbi:MAG: energy transducer TonB [Elusimicrobiota bacterium]|nr:energy transducer TonB [Elusimicrobiota bacterium]
MTGLDGGGRLLSASIAASAALHSLLFMPWPVPHSHAEPPELMELDLAGPPGPAGSPAPAPAKTGRRADDWRLPADASVPAAPAPASPAEADPGDADAPSEGPGAEGGGPAGGGGSGRGTVRPPVLLNHGELHRLLQRLYPESERELGREGMVVLSLSVGIDGRVTGAEIVRSAGAAFDSAALRLSDKLRYAPAEDAGRPIAVRMRQSVLFKLER